MTTTRNHDLTAREYLRVSIDRSGRQRSIDEQHQDNARAAGELGWHLGEPYRDTGSASRYATNGRDGYDQLVADLVADRFGAGALMLWEHSRGSRRVGEWVSLIELCEDRGVRIHVTTHARTYDPGNPRDRRSLLEDAVDSEYESGKLSSRAKRAAAANAAEGKPHGRIPYGYRRRYDERTRKFIAQEPDSNEAPIVRELFDRLSRGHSLRSIAADLDRRGVRTRTGRPWGAQHLRSVALARVYVGEREHNGQVTAGQWPALVDRSTWLAVRSILTAPERLTRRPGRAVHLLSMIAVCDVCDGPMAASGRGGRWHYQCHRKTHVKVDYDELTELAEAAMLGYLSRPDNVERLTAAAGDDKRVQAARDELASVREELDDLGDRVGRGELSATLAARAEPRILERLRAAEDREAQLSTPSALRRLITPGADVARRWKAAPMSARREVARILLSPEVLGQLRVKRSPGGSGQRVHAADRVEWRRA